MSEWRCPRCGVKNAAGWGKCENCARNRPTQSRPAGGPTRIGSTAPVLALLQPRLSLTPEEEAQIEVERARIKALLAPVQKAARGLPPVAPEVRAEVARRAKVSDRVEPPDLKEMDAEVDW